MYRHTMELMSQLEEDVLRVATYHLERYSAQLVEAGRGIEVNEIDRLAILDDAWAFEAAFSSARHRALLAYFSAYRHSEAWSVVHDLFAGLGTSQGGLMGPVTDIKPSGGMSALLGGTVPRPFGIGPTAIPVDPMVDKWDGMSVNTPQPQLLAARVQLRRELLDLSFR